MVAFMGQLPKEALGAVASYLEFAPSAAAAEGKLQTLLEYIANVIRATTRQLWANVRIPVRH